MMVIEINCFMSVTLLLSFERQRKSLYLVQLVEYAFVVS